MKATNEQVGKYKEAGVMAGIKFNLNHENGEV